MRKEAYNMLDRKRDMRNPVSGTTTIKSRSNLPIPILGIRTQVVDFIDFNAGGLGLRTAKHYPRFSSVHGKAQLQTGIRKPRFKWKGTVVWSKYDEEKQNYRTGVCLTRRHPDIAMQLQDH